MIIRHATMQDAGALRNLLAQMGSNYERSVDDITNRLSAFERSEDQLLVAEVDNQLVGVIAFGCYQQFRLQGCCCHIDTLVIDAPSRGKGIGKQLMLKAEAYAREHGATEIETTSANHRILDGTHAFYKSLGYKNHIDIDCAYFAKEGMHLEP